ncbi:hypothetical protein SK128_012800, partial [Halocaridina rubra]
FSGILFHGNINGNSEEVIEENRMTLSVQRRRSQNTNRTTEKELPVQKHDKNKNYFLIADQYSPELLEFVRRRLHPPSPRDLPYNLSSPLKMHYSQFNQSLYLEKLLKGKRNGTFVELGALDGEYDSNTLYFERELGWTGILIEPNPDSFNKLITKGRKSFCIQAAASLINMSALLKLKREYIAQMSYISYETTPDMITVEAYPLYTMLKAVNLTKIDFLSLDVEGAEIEVLETIPWHQITVMVMCIEHPHSEGGAQGIAQYMKKFGYIVLEITVLDIWLANKALLEQHLGSELSIQKVIGTYH